VLLLVAALTALACAAVMQLAGRQLTAQTSLPFGSACCLLVFVSQQFLGAV
jgi:leader peptidase (prepilin peptidase) / N-methyltransferase